MTNIYKETKILHILVQIQAENSSDAESNTTEVSINEFFTHQGSTYYSLFYNICLYFLFLLVGIQAVVNLNNTAKFGLQQP